MKLGIKNGKIYDICSDLRNKRDDSISDKDYLDLPIGDWEIEDIWDFEKNESLKDSPIRFIEKEKTELEIRIDDLETRITELEKQKEIL